MPSLELPSLPAEKPLALDATELDAATRHLADLIVLTFRYSQGSGKLGAQLLSLIADDYPETLPEGNFPDAAVTEAATIVRSIYFSSHPNYPATYPANDAPEQPLAMEYAQRVVRRQLSQMEANKAPRTYVIKTIAEGVLLRDINFIVEEDPGGGRTKPGRLPSRKPQAFDATFLSHYCFFGLAGNATGAQEFDKIFDAITSPAVIHDLTDSGRRSYQVKRLLRVLAVHFKHMPGDFEQIPSEKVAALTQVLGEEAVQGFVRPSSC